MSFEDAFRNGIAAFEDAERAIREIVEVFSGFAGDVSRASGGKVEVMRGGKKEVISGFLQVINFGAPAAPPALEPHTCLIACAILPQGAPSNDSKYLLAEYALSPAGYPVTLAYSDESIQCLDRQSLGRALERMLKHPDTGGKLLRLMRLVDRHRQQQTPNSSSPGDPKGG